MRTTLAIDDDVLAAARGLARQQRRTIGEVLSDLARQGLQPPGASRFRNGVLLLPARENGVRVTPEMIPALDDDVP